MADDTEDSGGRFSMSMDDATAAASRMGGAFANTAAVFMTGTPGIADALSALSSMGGVLGDMGDALTDVIGYLETQTELYQTLSRRGVHFGGRLDELSLSAIEARLNLDQLATLVEENSEVIAGFGATADSGLRQFLRRSAQFMETEYATQLRRLGMTFEDINDTLVDYESMLALTGHTNRLSDAERNRAAAEFAMELDVLSKLTGKQAEQIAEEMRERQREGDYRAFLMGLSPDQVEAVMSAQAQAEAAGVGELFKDMMVRGVPSTETTRMQAAMMGESFDLMAQMRQQILSGNTAGFEQNAAGLAGVALNEMSSETYRSVAMLGGLTSAGQAAASALGDVSEANFRYISMIRDFERQTGRRPTAAQAADMARQARAEAEAEQREQMEDAPEGDTRAVLQSVLGLQDQILATAEEVQRVATTRLYQELAQAVRPFVDELNQFNPRAFVDDMASGLGDFASNAFDSERTREAERMATEMFNVPGASEQALRLREITEQLRNETDPSRRAALQAELDQLMESLSNFEVNADYANVNADEAYFNGVNPPGRDTGSIGTTGNILEDFGRESMALLHGREAVLTEQQLTTLASNLVNFGESQAFGGIIQELRQLEGMVLRMGTISNIRNIAPVMQGMLNNIGPQMQSMMTQMAPQMESLAQQMMPVMQQMASEMQGPMREMAEQMRGPMENMASTMQRQLGVSTRSLRAVQGAGNLFRGLNV